MNCGVAPFPANDGKESITLGVQDYFFGFKKEGNQEAVQKFLSFLFEPDNYAGFLEAAGGFLPATISAGEAMSSDPALAPFIEVLPSAIFYPSDQAAWPAVQTAVQQTIGTAPGRHGQAAGPRPDPGRDRGVAAPVPFAVRPACGDPCRQAGVPAFAPRS